MLHEGGRGAEGGPALGESEGSVVKYAHVVVEGSIGVGKTTLATALARHWGARAVLEKPEHNPFLEDFYAHGAGRDNPFALQTQLSFLFQRVEQMRELSQAGVFEAGVVSDFLFAKDSLFAMLNLGDEDLALYRQIYRREQQRVAEPDLVIWLQAEPDVLMNRIRARGRPMEQGGALGAGIDEDYLEGLNEAYRQFFTSYRGAPVLAVNVEAFHPAERPNDWRRLLDAMAGFEGSFAYLDPADLDDGSLSVSFNSPA